MNLLLQVWFAPVGAFVSMFSDEFWRFWPYNNVQLILELTKPMFDETFEVCGNFSMRMPKFRFILSLNIVCSQGIAFEHFQTFWLPRQKKHVKESKIPEQLSHFGSCGW